MAKQKKQKNNKGSIGASIFGMVLFLLLGVLLFITDAEYLFSEPRDLNEMLAAGETPEKGEYVTVGVDAVVDWYAETEHKINGIIPIGKEQHCLVWLDDESFISMTVKGKNIDKVNKIVLETSYFLNGVSDALPTKVVFSGKISTIGSEVSEYYDEVLDAYGIYASDGLVIRYVTIDTTSTKLTSWLLIGVCLLIAVVFLITLVVAVKNKKKEKKLQAMLAAQASYGNPMQPGTVSYGNTNNQGMGEQNMPYTDDNNNLYR